jgi:hypothetical protein
MGVSRPQAGRGSRRGRHCLIAAGATITLTACGSQAAATDPAATNSASPTATAAATAGVALCANAAKVNRLVISRVSTIPQNHFRFAFPRGVTVSDPAKAQAVATALCALPSMPHGAVNCPNDSGVAYRLSFAAAGRGFPMVTAQASGCMQVLGVGAVRTISRSPGFWTALGRAIGIPHPSSTALRGGRTVPPDPPHS